MKKYLALLLSMLLLVGGARIEPEQGGTKPEPGQPDDVSAKLPDTSSCRCTSLGCLLYTSSLRLRDLGEYPAHHGR